MARIARRRARSAPRFEALETRAMLSSSTVSDLFVGFSPGTSAAQVQTALSEVGGQVVQTFPDGSDQIALKPGTDPAAALDWLHTDPAVQYAEVDGTLHAAAIVPNDPRFPQQWGLSNPNGVSIDAPQAWSITTGAPSTLVAVLDTGIDFSSPDLSGRIWINPSPGADGYPGDVNGWNFVGNNSNVQDYDGHGTHVSGILAADGNNGIGVAGVAWNVTIMPVKVLNSSGDGSVDAAINGIYYAVNHGARVINASWGGGSYSQAMANAIAYAGSHNVVFVTAAGNDGTNSDSTPSYPGSYRLSNEITVAAVDSSGNLASFSDFGAQSVDLAAPGVNIWSTVPGGYAAYSGTSMATPFVSGVVALVASLHPEFSATQLVQRVLSTTKPLPSLAGTTVTGGIVDAFYAVNFVQATGGPISLQANGSTPDSVLAQVLATDDFYAASGGTDASFVTALYKALADRAPDPGGLGAWVGWLQGGASRLEVVQAFQGTPEALATKVAHWYQDVLGWNEPIALLKADPGVAHWVGLLAGGETDNQVLAQMLDTNDYFVANGGGTYGGFVSALYKSLLGRGADPSGYNNFVGLLQQGMSRLDLINIFLSTFEAKRTTVARWYQEDMGWTAPLDQLKIDPGVSFWAGFIGNT